MMWSTVLSSLVICSVAFGAVGSPQLVTIWAASLEDQTTTAILSGFASDSAVDVINSITNYQVIEVDSLLIVKGSATTQTVLSTPTTLTYTIERGASFLGNTVSETVVPTPGVTIVDTGFVACEPPAGVVPSPGVEAQCVEVITESVVNGIEVVTTIGFDEILYAATTLTALAVVSTVDTGSSTAPENSSPPTPSPASPLTPVAPAAPISQVTVFPTQTSSTMKNFSGPQILLIATMMYSTIFFAL